MTNRTDPAAVARPGIPGGSRTKPVKPVLLAIETGSRACSVAIFEDTEMRGHERQDTDHGHATILMPMIERVRSAAGCAYTDLDRIAVAVGPGSFTGLRVGIAAALGISLASGVPAVGISSFQVAAAGLPRGLDLDGYRYFVLLDSRRDEPFFAELNQDLSFVGEPVVMPLSEFDALLLSAGPTVVLGDAPAVSRPPSAFPAGIQPRPLPLDAKTVGALAAAARRYDLSPKPVYVRAPDVTMPKTA